MRAIVTRPTRYGLPIVPSSEARCIRCGAATWLSLSAVLEPGDVILCVICAMSEVKPGDLLEPAPWAREDLAEWRNDG